MAWNDPGNGKQRDPWGSGGGDQPPDLDEVFRKLQGRLKGLFGGGGSGGDPGGGGGIALIIGLLLVAWLVWDSFYIIDEPEQGVVLRFGKYADTMQPGLNVTWPRPIDYVYRVNVEQVRSETTEGSMLTRDENIVAVSLAVQYQVSDAQNFLFRVNDPIDTLEQSAESAMRQVVGDNNMDFVLLEGRAEIAQSIRVLLQQILDRYETGLRLTTVNLQEIRPPQQVKDAFDDAIKAREDKERYENEAEAFANRIVPEARGRAARVVQQAEAYKESVIARAEGQTQRFSLLLDEYLKAPGVTRQRLYLETMESVLQQTSKVMVDVDQGNNVMYLPLDKLIPATLPAVQQRQNESTVGGSNSSQENFRPERDLNRRGREGR